MSRGQWGLAPIADMERSAGESEEMPSPSTATRAVLSEIERWPVRAELLRELRPQDGSGYRRSSLYTRVLLVNVVVLVAASAVLAFTPARVPFPSSVEKVGVLVANALLLRVSFGPLAQLVKQMLTIDLLMPGQRMPVSGGVEVRTVIEGF